MCLFSSQHTDVALTYNTVYGPDVVANSRAASNLCSSISIIPGKVVVTQLLDHLQVNILKMVHLGFNHSTDAALV